MDFIGIYLFDGVGWNLLDFNEVYQMYLKFSSKIYYKILIQISVGNVKYVVFFKL